MFYIKNPAIEIAQCSLHLSSIQGFCLSLRSIGFRIKVICFFLFFQQLYLFLIKFKIVYMKFYFLPVYHPNLSKISTSLTSTICKFQTSILVSIFLPISWFFFCYVPFGLSIVIFLRRCDSQITRGIGFYV